MADEPEPLLAPFAGLCGALRGLQAQVEALARVHAAVDAFNASFGAFQNAVGLHASCLQFPRARAKAPALGAAPGATGIPLPQATSAVSTQAAASSIPKPTVAVTPPTAPTAGRSSTGNKSADRSAIPRQRPPASSKKRSVKIAAGQKTQQRPAKKRNIGQPPPPPAWTWEKWVLEKVPKKYQSPQEIKKLENIILYIKNRGEGISIADLVKHSGLAVIKCKEILQTLMKLELIERKHEESGFVYTFGSSS